MKPTYSVIPNELQAPTEGDWIVCEVIENGGEGVRREVCVCVDEAEANRIAELLEEHGL